MDLPRRSRRSAPQARENSIRPLDQHDVADRQTRQQTNKSYECAVVRRLLMTAIQSVSIEVAPGDCGLALCSGFDARVRGRAAPLAGSP